MGWIKIMTKLCFPTLVSAERKKHLKNLFFWCWTLKCSRPRRPLHAIACHQELQKRSKWERQQQPWSLRQEATLYAGASFDTFTEMCHKACLGSHFVRFVTPYMAPLQQHSAPTGSTVLYLSSSV